MLEIVLGDYRKHIYTHVFVQEIVLREETILCINRKYINKVFVYVLETDPYRGCIKHMCNKVHRDLCVRDRPILRQYKTYKKLYTCIYVLETDSKGGCIQHVKS